MWHMGDGWGWWMIVNWVWIIGFWLIIFWAVRALLGSGRSDTTPPPPDRHQPDALEILNRRYANGDISEDDYERMRRRILGHTDAGTTD